MDAPGAALAPAAPRAASRRPDASLRVTVEHTGEEFTALGCCAACGSADVRSVPVVYAEGTRVTRTTGSGVTIGSVGGANAIAGTRTASVGQDQSLLAAGIAPPNQRPIVDNSAAAVGCLIGLLGAVICGIFFGGAGVFWGGFVLAILWTLLYIGGLFTDRDAIAWNVTQYPKALKRWQESIVCLRCGAVTESA